MACGTSVLTQSYHSPCGDLLLGACGDRLCLCDWAVEGRLSMARQRVRRTLNADLREGQSGIIDSAKRQLDEYFSGRRTVFSVPLLPLGTDFQQSVWRMLLSVPYGSTLSYGSMAALMGKPKAVRAVASANHANLLSIFIPCHRVIGSDGSLVGYGGGLDAKKFLLDLEKSYVRM